MLSRRLHAEKRNEPLCSALDPDVRTEYLEGAARRVFTRITHA